MPKKSDIFLILVPKTAAARFLMETESAGALVHSALTIKGDRKISYWILNKNERDFAP